MANNLSASQRTAFSLGYYDLGNLVVVHELDNRATPTPVVTDITPRVSVPGETRLRLYNLTPADPGEFEFPAVTWTCRNEDFFFTEGASGSVWGSKIPTEFLMRLTVRDEITDPTGATKLATVTFAVVDLELDTALGIAKITGAVELVRYWASTFKRADQDFVNLNAVWQSEILP